jgi:molybdopterin-binding protein
MYVVRIARRCRNEWLGLRTVAHYRSGQLAELLGVSVDTVRRWCDEGRLETVRSEGGHRLVDGRSLARFVREQVDAYEPELLMSQSARNRFTGVVTRVDRDRLTAVIELRAGRFRIVSLLTREAADDLRLEEGDLATAVVKATDVIMEVPPI